MPSSLNQTCIIKNRTAKGLLAGLQRNAHAGIVADGIALDSHGRQFPKQLERLLPNACFLTGADHLACRIQVLRQAKTSSVGGELLA